MEQYIYLGTFDLRDHVYGEFNFDGGGWKIKSGGAVSLASSNRKDAPDASKVSFSVVFGTEAEAHKFLQYVYTYSPDSPGFNEEAGADIPLFIRSSDWYYNVWGVSVTPGSLNRESMDYLLYCYEVTCYLYSPYSYFRNAGAWAASNQALNETYAVSNRLGHLPSSFELLQVTTLYNAGLVSALALNFGSTSVTLADNCLTNELYEYYGNDGLLYVTYEDAITSATQWGQDWTGSGEAFDTDHMELDNAVSQYIKLSGPNRLAYPVTMTADLSLDSGGATGKAYVYISSDGINWILVLEESDFVSGSTEYTLDGSDYMTDCYVKFVCSSGTAGKFLNVGSIKFECTRLVAYGAPTVAAGANATATLTGTGNVTIAGQFLPRRLFV